MAILGPFRETIPEEKPLIRVEPIKLPESAPAPVPAGVPVPMLAPAKKGA